MSNAPPSPAEAAPAWDDVPGILLVLQADGAAQALNAAACHYLGLARDNALGAQWLSQLDADSRAALLSALAQGSRFVLPLRLIDDQGQQRQVTCTAQPSRTAGLTSCLLREQTVDEQALVAERERSHLFRLMTDNVPVMMAYYRTSDLTCRFANEGYAQTFGLTSESIVGKVFAEVIGEKVAQLIEPQVQALMSQRKPVSYERRIDVPGQPTRWMEVNLLPHQEPGSDELVGVFVQVADISKHRVAEQAVRESELRLGKFMAASTEGIVFHRDGLIIDANPPMCALIGYTLEEMLGRKTLDFIAPEQVAKVSAVIESGQETTYESRAVHKSGEQIPVEFIVRTITRGEDHMRMTIVRDLRDRQAAQERIHHLAHHDMLTGLPNRMSFMEQLDHRLIAAKARGSRLALLFIDLDHFKRVNDSLGHMVGDTLLRTVATRITSCLRASDIVARFGGDEFMVLLPGLPSQGERGTDVGEVAQKLLAAIEVPVIAEGRPISVTPSVGIALFPDDGETPHELVKHADSAMYLAKSRGRANFQFFEAGMARAAYAALVMEGQLAQALEHGEFELYYQPQVRARGGQLVGAEALIRWNHPERGLLLPNEFIHLAERQRLMLRIGQWVLQESARAIKRWHAMDLGVPTIAVNLSTLQFLSPGFVEAVSHVLPADGLDSGMLELELTERMLMDDMAEVKSRLSQLRSMGLSISVDDFGTGYSSLGHLKDLPIDKLKIDRSFVKDLPSAHSSVAIASAIIQMGRSLGMTVVAEGVETSAQGEFLAAQGCDELQGYLVSPPLPLMQFESWVQGRQAPPP